MADDDYEIGYGKPPQSHRFTKGQSGNSKGRPKGKRNLATTISSIVSEKVVITENGRKKSVTKLEAAVKQMVNRAAGGDLKYLRLLVQLMPLAENADTETGKTLFSKEGDRKLLADLLGRAEFARAHAAPAITEPDNKDMQS
jgi:hypothetical protein